ncbi:hypothetical protein KSC_012130 [Ktedonobacter sp. SOSP1-52]|uniref:hypothetical protein n=1 Tax=Ktedonobacter sp. SOSP1-52 TaxID=2778366 RepID=UPI0019168B74|nr:hypothetical protein [Ktedonobacter sp. SOSP1-52]GHO62321.1 hypothetical protein KSC_012130 [Ktedonobacter sp. SOSP1-52]
MEPITTTAILAAVASGAIGAISGGITELGKKTVVDSYTALTTLLKKKFGEKGEVAEAVERLEKKPDSDARKEEIKEVLAEVKADEDSEIRRAAQAVLDQLKTLPGGEQHIQQAIGSYIAQADRGSTASVTIHDPRRKEK